MVCSSYIRLVLSKRCHPVGSALSKRCRRQKARWQGRGFHVVLAMTSSLEGGAASSRFR
jgi:hypothetical protein